MWVAPQLSHLIHKSEHSRADNAQWVRLKGVLGGDVAVLNVYAPHSLAERSALWMELLARLPQGCRWLMAGDWNFVERSVDKSNSRLSSVTKEEKRIFQEFKDHFQVEDSFSAGSRLKYSLIVKAGRANDYGQDLTEPIHLWSLGSWPPVKTIRSSAEAIIRITCLYRGGSGSSKTPKGHHLMS